MTTLDTLGSADPDLDEVSDAALAMADFDAKRRDYATALDWLAVAAQHRTLTREPRQEARMGVIPPTAPPPIARRASILTARCDPVGAGVLEAGHVIGAASSAAAPGQSRAPRCPQIEEVHGAFVAHRSLPSSLPGDPLRPACQSPAIGVGSGVSWPCGHNAQPKPGGHRRRIVRHEARGGGYWF